MTIGLVSTENAQSGVARSVLVAFVDSHAYAPPVCPRCDELMESLGNATGQTYTTDPPQWDEVFVCHRDRVRLFVRRHGQATASISPWRDYEPIA